MGYRSEWQLLVRGKKEAADRFVAHLKAEKDKPENKASDGGYYDRASVYETILDRQGETEDLEDGEVGLVFGDTGTKCYYPWGEVITDLIDYARDELGLQIAYGRLGEDMDDSTFHNDDGLYVCCTRTLDEPSW